MEWLSNLSMGNQERVSASIWASWVKFSTMNSINLITVLCYLFGLYDYGRGAVALGGR
jgi:hypothetical protein